MTYAIVPFAAAHRESAAVLLADRHRRVRAAAPALPGGFETTAAAGAVLDATLHWPGVAGVAALDGGRLVGFLLGAVVLMPPTNRSAPFLAPRAGVVPYHGHATTPGAANEIWAAMYEALAPAWVDAACYAHYVHLAPSEAGPEEAWRGLGFAPDTVAALRATDPPSAPAPGLEIRRARPDELETVMGFSSALLAHHARPPMYIPRLRETERDERTYQAKLLADPACAHWLAFRDGEAVGMQSFQPPPAFLSPLVVPEAATYLLQGVTLSAARGTGVGRALLARSMAWARDAGHQTCLLHFLGMNRVAARFWLGSGFRPVELRLVRRIDERVAWGPRVPG